MNFKLENAGPNPYAGGMRLLVAPLLSFLLVVLTGCESTEDAYVPGRISKERAIAIAMEANRQYPYPLSRYGAVWRPQGGYWSVEFKDEEGDFGKFYLVDAKGHIVGQGRIINAIRAVAATAAARQNMRCVVNVDGA